MTKQPTVGIVLAAGSSTRMGCTKQLLALGGKTMLVHVVEAALGSSLAEVVLVLGHEADRVTAALGSLRDHERLLTLFNKRYREGMASSLQAGLAQVKERFPSAMFLLGDQPLINAAAINLLLHRFWSSEKDICVPIHGSRPGNPACFSRSFYERILSVQGDVGAREIIRGYPDDVLPVESDDPAFFMDIDYTADLDALPSNLVFKS